MARKRILSREAMRAIGLMLLDDDYTIHELDLCDHGIPIRTMNELITARTPMICGTTEHGYQYWQLDADNFKLRVD